MVTNNSMNTSHKCSIRNALIASSLSRTELPLLLPSQESFVASLQRFQQQNILFPNQTGLLSDSSPLLFHIIYKIQALKQGNDQLRVHESYTSHTVTVLSFLKAKKVFIPTTFQLQPSYELDFPSSPPLLPQQP